MRGELPRVYLLHGIVASDDSGHTTGGLIYQLQQIVHTEYKPNSMQTFCLDMSKISQIHIFANSWHAIHCFAN